MYCQVIVFDNLLNRQYNNDRIDTCQGDGSLDTFGGEECQGDGSLDTFRGVRGDGSRDNPFAVK